MTTFIYLKKYATTSALIAVVSLSGCTDSYRPTFTPIHQSLSQTSTNPAIPTSIILPQPMRPAAGSLWQPGSKQFFKDSRASRIGDIVTVIVDEEAEAEVEGTTETKRNHAADAELTNLLNLEGKLIERGIGMVADNLLDTDSNRTYKGEGKTDRKDTLTASIAAIVTQVLPNGYLVIQGKREVVVNYELQELNIQGIVRPEDISSENTIPSAKIAEARIFYAGKGIVDETQTPQYGVRFLDKVMPF